MEPYRAYVSDWLGPDQRPLGFLTQSAFTGLAQTLSYLAPSLLVWWGIDKDLIDANGIPEITRISFLIGAFLSIATILWSVVRVPELPLNPEEDADIAADSLSLRSTVTGLIAAMRDMPPTMRQLAVAMLFQCLGCSATGNMSSSRSPATFMGRAIRPAPAFAIRVCSTASSVPSIMRSPTSRDSP